MYELELVFGHSVLYISPKENDLLRSLTFEVPVEILTRYLPGDPDVLLSLADLPAYARKQCESMFLLVEKIAALQYRKPGTYQVKSIDNDFCWNVSNGRYIPYNQETKESGYKVTMITLNPDYMYVLHIPSKEKL